MKVSAIATPVPAAGFCKRWIAAADVASTVGAANAANNTIYKNANPKFIENRAQLA